MSGPFTNAELAAFLDGTLDDDALLDRIEAAINADPALAERAEALAAGDVDGADGADGAGVAAAAVRDAFAPVLNAPVPAHLTRIVAPVQSEVINFAAARAQRAAAALPVPANDTGSTWRWPQFGAMAASLALGVMIGGPLLTGGGIGGGAGSGDSANGANGASGALVLAAATGPATPPQVAAMLDTAPSGAAVDLASLGTGEVVLTFRDGDGRLCRQFTISGSTGTSDTLACAGGDNGWQVEAFGRRAAPAGELKLAGGDAAPAVVAAVDAVIASDPVVGADELAELKRK